MNAAPASIPPATPRAAAMLRRIRLLPRCRLARSCLLLGGRSGGRLLRGGRRLLLRRGTLRGRLYASESRLQVVEDEPRRRISAGRRGDGRLAVADDEDAAVARGDLELREHTVAGLESLGCGEQRACRLRELIRPTALGERRTGDLALVAEDHSGLDLGGDLGQVGECLLGVHAP